MSYGGSSGSGGRISTAGDTALSNPANNDVLTYNSATQKWVNQPQATTAGDSYNANSQTGSSYALVLSDSGKIIENTGTAALTVTVPANASVAFPVGTTIELLNYSTGSITIAAAGGVALRSVAGLRLTSQYAPAAIRKRTTDEWIVTGATVA